MITSALKKAIFGTVLLCTPLLSLAEASQWNIVPDKSQITFTATQNNAPVTGEFKSFTGDIHFDAEQLSISHITITVDINSISTSYAEIAKTLLTADWFNAKMFPTATFKAQSFSKMGENTYQANGTLTLRDKSSPIILLFILQPLSKTTVIAKGEATLQRINFSIGKGEWASTDDVKDEVKVAFVLTATKK